jgi:hypothetical protein
VPSQNNRSIVIDKGTNIYLQHEQSV